MDRTYRLADSESSTLESVLVVLATDEGIRGIGTADPVPGHPTPDPAPKIYDDLRDTLLPTVLETDPPTPNHLWRLFDEITGRENGKSAIETAFLDAYCRQRDQSLAEFFGGPFRDREALNAWIGIDSPDAMAAEAETCRDRGFESLKMKIAGDVQADLERIRAVHRAVGEEVAIRVDANEAYDVAEALELVAKLEPLGLAHVEQPVSREDLEGLAEVTRSSSVPIMADEPVLGPADGYRILQADGADWLKYKILKAGGARNARIGLDAARLAGVSCVLGHGFCTPPTASAELQLAAAHDNVYRPVETVGTLKLSDHPFDPGIRIGDGYATVPDGPGLGVGLDDDRLEAFTIASATLE